MKALGLNAITAYVAWNYHEEVEGQIHDLEMVSSFLELIHKEGMLVILRPGPYICAEWEFGGLPSFLLAKPDIQLRTYNAPYIQAVDRWLNTLYASITTKVYSKGGPIIAVQIENEYGFFGDCSNNHNDKMYMYHLHDLALSYFGPDIVYTTIDEPWHLSRGTPWFKNSSVLATVDGGLESAFGSGFWQQIKFNAAGYSPKMWSELWTGWYTSWGAALQSNKSVIQTHVSLGWVNDLLGEIDYRINRIFGADALTLSSISYKDGVQGMINAGGSFSLYMAHGGTNFGFWSGAMGKRWSNGPDSFQPIVTSYDYSAPISEGGDHNIGADSGDLYLAVQRAISSKYGKSPEEPPPIQKAAYGKIAFNESASLFESLDELKTCNHVVHDNSVQLPSFEKLSLPFGFVLYSRTPGLTGSSSFSKQTLNFNSFTVHDRVQVFVDGSSVGSASRQDGDTSIHIPQGENMSLLVENMGRINAVSLEIWDMYDYKGLLMKPPVDGNWTAYCLPLASTALQKLKFSAFTKVIDGQPTFRRGNLEVTGTPTDTYLDTDGLTKGIIWVNGNNLGRFWHTRGPQQTMYVPAPFLRSGANEVIVLDLEGSAVEAIQSVERPRWSPTTPRQDIRIMVEANVLLAVLLIVVGCVCRRRHLCRDRCPCWASKPKLLENDDCESPKVLLEGDNRYRLMAG